MFVSIRFLMQPIHCTCTLRWNMSKDAEERTIESIKICAKLKSRSAKIKTRCEA